MCVYILVVRIWPYHCENLNANFSNHTSCILHFSFLNLNFLVFSLNISPLHMDILLESMDEPHVVGKLRYCNSKLLT